MDLVLVETKNGGDIIKKGNDLLLLSGWGNMPYIAMFGGNLEAVTIPRKPGTQAYDYWANNLLMPNNSSAQFNSLTENTLRKTPLTSAGRILIQQAIEKDLAFMKDFADIVVTVVILDTYKVKISILVIPIVNVSVDETTFNFIYDGMTNVVTGDFSLFDFNDDFFK